MDLVEFEGGVCERVNLPLNEEILRRVNLIRNPIEFAINPNLVQVNNAAETHQNPNEENVYGAFDSQYEEISNVNGSADSVRNKCYNYNMGYCKYRRNCANFHPTLDCPQKPCYNNFCQKRHRIPCKFALKNGSCKFGKKCEFLHEAGTGARSKRKARKSFNAGEQEQTNVSSSRESNLFSSRQSNVSSSRPSNVTSSRQRKESSSKDGNIKRKMEEDIKIGLARIKELEDKMNADEKIVTEQVDNVANKVEEAGSGINKALEDISLKVIAFNNMINVLWKDVRKLRNDCEEHDSHQEHFLNEMLAARRNKSLPVQKAEP